MRCAYFSFQPFLARDPRGLACASAALLEGISPFVEVDLIYLAPGMESEKIREDLLGRFPQLRDVRVFNSTFERSWTRRVRLGLSLLPYSLDILWDSELHQVVEETHEDLKYDVVHYDYMLWLSLHPMDGHVTHPTMCSGPDAFSLAYLRKSFFADGFFVKIRERLASQAFLRFERRYLPKADILQLVSAEDGEYLRTKGIEVEIRITNMALEHKWFAKPETITSCRFQRKRILVSGQHNHPWYKKGLERFLCGVWPKILKMHPDSTLSIHSSHGSPEIERLAKIAGNAKILGFVEDYRALFNQHDYFLHPLLSGTGQKNRLLIAMAQGLCCFATNAAVSGTGLKPCEDYIPLTDLGEADVGRLIEVLGNQGFSSQIALSGRRKVEAEFHSQAVGRKIVEIYKDTIRLCRHS